jgi:hypothetical protein
MTVIEYFLQIQKHHWYGDDPIDVHSNAKFTRVRLIAPSTRNNVWGIQAVKKDNFVF